jgi:hypothetical protein
MSSLSTVAMPNRSQQRYVVDTVCARARDITIAKLRLRQPFRCFGADALELRLAGPCFRCGGLPSRPTFSRDGWRAHDGATGVNANFGFANAHCPFGWPQGSLRRALTMANNCRSRDRFLRYDF